MKFFNDSILDELLIAPCGMNCGICSAYLAYANNLQKERGKISHCTGCRIRNKKCAFIKRDCKELRTGQFEFCFECKKFPCKRLQTIDNRYRKNYSMSMIDNLNEIKSLGIKKFVNHQKKKYSCENCGEMKCIHNKKCYRCETIECWRN